MPYKDRDKKREYNRIYNQLHKRPTSYWQERWQKQRYDISTKAQDVKLDVLTHYGNGKCACVQCGYDNGMALSIDHIDSNGASHRRAIHTNGGIRLYQWLKKHNYPDGFQTLCMNCQWIKKRTNNEYGWEQKGKLITTTTSHQLNLLSSVASVASSKEERRYKKR